MVAANDAAVIATAGSIVADETTFAQLLEQTYVVWLKATPDEHMRRVLAQGDLRPMAHNPDAMNDLVAILNARAVDYGRAHAHSIRRARASRRAGGIERDCGEAVRQGVIPAERTREPESIATEFARPVVMDSDKPLGTPRAALVSSIGHISSSKE